MTDPVFLVGARVRFGVAPDGYPLYGRAQDIDLSQWEYVSGRVIKREDYGMVDVEYTQPETKEQCIWLWPLAGHALYQPEQWQQPGFLALEQPQTLFQDLLDFQAREQATMLRTALEATNWNMTKAADLLGFKKPVYLYSLIKNSFRKKAKRNNIHTRKKSFFQTLWEEYQTKKLSRGRPKKSA